MEHGEYGGQVSVTTQVADRVKSLRSERRWSAQRLADECARAGSSSLTRGTIAKIESGVRKSITVDELATLSGVLGVSPDVLIGAGFAAPETLSVRQATEGRGGDHAEPRASADLGSVQPAETPEPAGGIRVLLVDDQEFVRNGLRRVLRRDEGFVIAGECADGAEVPAALAAGGIDVIVMDLRMKDVDGIEATRRLRQSGSDVPVLALTTFDDDELLAGALRAGAVGYVLKDSPVRDFVRAVRVVAGGEAWLDAAVTKRVLAAYRAASTVPSEFASSTGQPASYGHAGALAASRPQPAWAILTASELEVLRALGRGETDAEIADALAISEVTVNSHLSRIFTKLDLRNRADAIVYAFDHGINAETAVEATRQQPARSPAKSTARPDTSSELRLTLLGPVRARRSGIGLDLGPIRQQALLAALVLRPDTAVSADELVNDVWGLEPPGTGGRVVPVYVHRLRKCLQVATVIVRDRSGYRFASSGVWVDAARLDELADEADGAEQAGDIAAAVALSSRALELFEGTPLAGLTGPFADGQRLRLEERRMTLSVRKLEWQLRLGHHDKAVAELLALAKEHPHSEPIAALLIRALHASDRRADGLKVYQEISTRLVRDLGVEPGKELRRVRDAILP
ncbi:BTAD domain-containing putative transcriptional regulator [Amycolatopsis sp. SID8362]|uniref:BTAD domain-containing putative transcriptional regulator n=1 Tax=Amycolatopsis sp. SID8362 TaxID=2690346 RepID=UPI00136E4D95|nr:BTAD domain-containing putative transcriptional regulator [Amycolatopsis sp. SID8362]NBH03498.1 response regulator [Amycolatopsis sp. SID8362]NED40198.1 response regulator [Amycolatopsis sp. SID8362]